eukprot:CAMPEP_0194181214 /NCGR_PEP_ID=MMETSP0154-20130528/19981_1 /TAXON_ID=1049557 /ORGANISM="Thalassiothrix antarctica, Strain L6-D1" /LENGTH=84 /DNA_ID=CAMNT_0038897131 /DNA_START=77 /DNA_END=331 /DNA_ORIENTATION=+
MIPSTSIEPTTPPPSPSPHSSPRISVKKLFDELRDDWDLFSRTQIDDFMTSTSLEESFNSLLLSSSSSSLSPELTVEDSKELLE